MAFRDNRFQSTWTTHLSLMRPGMLLLLLIGFFGLNRMNAFRHGVPTDRTSAESIAAVKALQEVAMDPVDSDLESIVHDDPSLVEALSLVQDKTIELKPVEMQAYWKLLQSVRGLSIEDLRSKGKDIASIHGLFQKPSEHRGLVSTHEMVVRRVLRYDDLSKDAKTKETLYEIWGSPDNARNWLFVLISPTLPEGFTETTLKGKRVEFVGYFFKLQAYHPANGKASDRPLLAPLFLGKVRTLENPLPHRQVSSGDWTSVIILVVAGIALAGLYFYFIRRTDANLRPAQCKKADRENLLLWIAATDEEQAAPHRDAT